MARFVASATRLALPPFSASEALRCIAALVSADASWVPRPPPRVDPAAPPFAYSLYIRPTVMATTPFLGVGTPRDATLYAICSPCGPYLPPSKAATTLFLDEVHVRAPLGGVGAFKVGSNYGPTVAPAAEAAARHGTAQVLFTAPAANATDGDRVVAEAGAMNVFFLMRHGGGAAATSASMELVTPPLDGTILPGVTRQSVLDYARATASTLLRDRLLVSERPLRVSELVAASREGRLTEVFATGTAAGVLPVDALVRADGARLRPVGSPTLAARLGAALANVQYGRTRHDWSVPIDSLV